MNGNLEKEGSWSYIEKTGASVIDYVVTNEEAREEVKKVIEENRTESNHIPSEVELEIGRWRRKKKKREIMEIERSIWTKEGVKLSREMQGMDRNKRMKRGGRS